MSHTIFPENLLYDFTAYPNEIWAYYDRPILGTINYQETHYIYNATWDTPEDGILYLWLETSSEIVDKVKTGTISLREAYNNPDTTLYKELMVDEHITVEQITYDMLGEHELPTVESYVNDNASGR